MRVYVSLNYPNKLCNERVRKREREEEEEEEEKKSRHLQVERIKYEQLTHTWTKERKKTAHQNKLLQCERNNPAEN